MNNKGISSGKCEYTLGCNNNSMPGKNRCHKHLHSQDQAKPLRTSKGTSYGTLNSGTGKQKKKKTSDS